MTNKVPPNHPLRRFFAGAVENVFYGELGICDPHLVGYLAELLVEFLHIRDIYSLKGAGGDRIEAVADMLLKAHVGQAVDPQDRERLVHRHVGDYTLYWTGVFPEGLGVHRHRRSKDVILDYYEQGKRSYAIASELSTPDSEPPAEVLQRLSDQFEYCAHGLTLARQAWDEADEPPLPGLLLG